MARCVYGETGRTADLAEILASVMVRDKDQRLQYAD
jgi:hypothetical protein